MTSVKCPEKRPHSAAARYFRFFANFAFRRWRPRVIAVAGSADKATMFHLIEFELGERAHYLQDTGSALAVVADLLGLGRSSKFLRLKLFFLAQIRALYYRRSEEFYVVEINDEYPKEAEFLTTWLNPEVILSLSSEAASTIKGTKIKTVEFDKKKLKRYNVYPTRTDFVFESTSFHFAQPQPKDIAVQLLMLESLVNYLGVPLRTDFSSMPVPPGRSGYFRGQNGLNIIDCSYDAHLISVQSILEMARNLRAGHKWLVIGDIIDQDKVEGEEHRKLANLIADVNPEMVILVGPRTKEYTAPRLRELGVPARTTLDPKKALTFIEQNATGEETLIFSGSQYLEWIIEKLLENPADAKYLPRRESSDVKRREKAGLK